VNAKPATLSELLDAALDLAPAEREQWIEALSDEHSELKPRLRALIARAAGIETSDFLSTLPKLYVGDPAESDRYSDAHAGDQIGPYRLVREIGTGGMGTVWLAERADGALRRSVALKFLRAQGGPREAFAERLARERDILAGLVHPGIARLYDAGLARDGIPYLALEYVEGEHIDAYVRRNQLDTPARLRLFLQVAHAVAYAHSKLVVHRDLKPGNVLVSADGQVHLLDFGIAKLLEDGAAHETRLTQIAGRAFTPEYASPEQILGEPISTASDVYSLGVMLYELLVESRPYNVKRNSRGALEDAILESDPVRLSERASTSALRRSLRGDLDAITQKALRKKPEERYATVSALAEDIERHLAQRPVLAQPDNTWYRLGKFARRNKLAVGSAAAVFVAVIVGAGVSVWQARVAIAQRQRAEEVRAFIESIFVEADPFGESGRPLGAAELLRQAKTRIGSLQTSGPEQRVDLLNTLASSLLNLQDLDAAASALEEAKAQAAGLESTDTEVLRTHRLLAQLDLARNQPELAKRELDGLIPTLQRAPERYPSELLAALLVRTELHNSSGEYELAETSANETLRAASVVGREKSVEAVEALIQLSYANTYRRRMEPASAAARRAYEMSREIFPRTSQHPVVNEARMQYAVALIDEDDVEPALDLMREGERNAAGVFGVDSRIVGSYAHKMSQYLANGGYYEESLAAIERAVRILGPERPKDSLGYASLLDNHGAALLSLRRPAESLPLSTRAREIVIAKMGPKHESAYVLQVHRARALAMLGQFEESERLLSETVERYRKSGYSSPSSILHFQGVTERLAGNFAAAVATQQAALDGVDQGPRKRRLSGRILVELGLARLELHDLEGARHAFNEALETYTTLYRVMSPSHADVLVGLGRLELIEERPAAAVKFLQEADAFWRKLDGENRWAGEAALWLGRAHLALGHQDDARSHLSRARAILAKSPLPGDRALVKLAAIGPS
jgi:tetratricopeptide (TPR) repeat protein